jgi:hypothetical protein
MCDDDDPSYDTDHLPRLTALLPPGLSDEALMHLHDVFEALANDLYNSYGAQIRRAWRARRREPALFLDEEAFSIAQQSSLSADDSGSGDKPF